MTTAKGFNCKSCGKRHAFSLYVVAHAHEDLTHTCEACGALHSVQDYRVKLIKAGKTVAQCGKCRYADFMHTPSGRVKKNVHGNCRAPEPPPAPILLCSPAPTRASRIGIWPNMTGECAMFAAVEGKAS